MNLPLGVQENCSGNTTAAVYFVETSPSVLREMPWITLREHQVSLFLPPPLSHSFTSFFSLRKVVQKCPSQMPVKCVEGMLYMPVISTASNLSLVMLVMAKHTTLGNSYHRAVALSLLLSMRHSLLCQPLRS